MRTPTFYRAVVTVTEQRLKLEWAQDSAFRFFPVQPDPQCGYRLHDADAATNKMLALAGRNEIRDFVDILHLGTDGGPVTPDPTSVRFASLQRHTGRIHGTWPTVHAYTGRT